ncbi:hypothetical protein JCM31598_12750 [Desulfonatronum parangueonense]
MTQSDKGKPSERVGRKANGLNFARLATTKRVGQGGRVAGHTGQSRCRTGKARQKSELMAEMQHILFPPDPSLRKARARRTVVQYW